MKWLLVVLVAVVWPGATAWALSVTPEREGPVAEPLPDLAADITWLHRARVQPASVATLATTTTVVLSTTSTTRHTTPPPTARAAAPRPQPNRANTAGVEQWRSLLASYGDWDVDLMLRIIRCESGGDPNARNRSSGAAGLTQIYPAREGSFDPATNIAQAHAKWSASGYSPWVSSRSCWG